MASYRSCCLIGEVQVLMLPKVVSSVGKRKVLVIVTLPSTRSIRLRHQVSVPFHRRMHRHPLHEMIVDGVILGDGYR